ncbi:MAG TPA: translocation/assembly module TamB domain-containing protein, partial [Vicinamibacterales bacterium]|nr:translocation/assembly module TamB domain-containing protein [Vicinamibacterales bacterium]
MRRVVRMIALGATLIVSAAALSLIVSQTPWFKVWLRGYIVRQANEYLNARLSIGQLGGNLFFGVELEDVVLTLDDAPVIQIKDIGLDYNFLNFISRGIVLDDIRVDRPVVRLVREQGGWNLGRLVKQREREADREGPGLPIAIGEIGITDGILTIDGAAGGGVLRAPERFERLNASIGFDYEPVRYTADIGHLSFRTSDPEFTLEELSGRLAVADDTVRLENLAIRTTESALRLDAVVREYQDEPVIEAAASSDKLALDEIARIVPALRGYTLQPAFAMKASGPLDALNVDFGMRSSAGDVDARIVAGFQPGVRTIRGRIDLRGLDLAPWLRNPAQRSDITGEADVDLRILARPRATGPLAALEGSFEITAPRVAVLGYEARNVEARGRFERGAIHLAASRAAAYGGRATASGVIGPGEPFALDLRGEASRLDLRNLPRSWRMPGLPGNLNLSYHVRGHAAPARRRDLIADAVFRGSQLAGAAVLDGSTARVRVRAPGRLEYAADMRVRDLDLQALGRGLGIDALAHDRYRTAINGRVTVQGSGTSLDTLALSARGALAESAALGGALPALDFDATIADGDAEVRVKGAFSDMNPAVIMGQSDDSRFSGEIDGTMDVRVVIRHLGAPFDPASLDASGRVEIVDSRLAGMPIDRALVLGRYENRAGALETLQVATPDLKLEASGPINLRTEGPGSNLEFRADIGRLEAPAALFDVPLSGSAQVEGRVTGNGSELVAEGNLQAGNIRYADHSVLSARTAYCVRLPNLTLQHAIVDVTGSATLLKVAGRELTGLDLEATWRHPSVRFRTTVTEGKRRITAGGDVVLHPDHQEVHLADFAVRADGMTWQTADGTEPAIRYGGGRIEVDNLHLVSGAQQISAAGAFGGKEGDTLHVSAQNVDLAGIDRLALGERRFGGTLTANATIRGTMDAPEVEATFAVRDGSFRDYRYQELTGTASYTRDGVRIDARLTQSPAAWITAEGFVPAALLRGSGQARGDEHREPAEGEALDLLVTSGKLDLAMIQGFVPQLSKVSGTLQAEIRATGAPDDPHFTGFVEIDNGAFTVADLTPAGYTGLDTRITLEPDRVVIDRFRILDEHRNWLEIDGELAVHERTVGEVQVAIKASEFEVVDNELADIKVDSDLRLTGRLGQPRLEGTIGVKSGTVHLDRILSDVVTGAYAVQPTDLETPPQIAAPVDEQPAVEAG